MGSTFLKVTIGKIMKSPACKRDAAIVIVWDEDHYAGYSGCCNSPTTLDKKGNVQFLGGANAPALVITSKDAEGNSDSSVALAALLNLVRAVHQFDHGSQQYSF